MQPFKLHRGIAVTLDTANVDTDQIIAKQFLKSISRTGFGEHLFHDWRYDAAGKPNPGFPLNHPSAKKASILVARNNFGCGSSREHAVWAIQQYGFRAIIAPWKISVQDKIPAFADIFRNNSGKNGLLTVELTDNQVDQIFKVASAQPGLELTVDLEKQVVLIHSSKELAFPFAIDSSVKHRLLHGLDDIGISLKSAKEIDRFEASHTTWISAQP